MLCFYLHPFKDRNTFLSPLFLSSLSVSLTLVCLSDSHQPKRHYNDYREEFYSDSLPSGFLNFEENNPRQQEPRHASARASRSSVQPQPHLPSHRRQDKHADDRNGKCADINVAEWTDRLVMWNYFFFFWLFMLDFLLSLNICSLICKSSYLKSLGWWMSRALAY